MPTESNEPHQYNNPPAQVFPPQHAFIGFQFELPLKVILWATLGVALIGMTNLAVSFALALRTALGARGIQFEHWGPLLRALWRRFRKAPRSFLLPPRAPVTGVQG